MFHKHDFASTNLSECVCVCVHIYIFNGRSKHTTTKGDRGEGVETAGQGSGDSHKPVHHIFTVLFF